MSSLFVCLSFKYDKIVQIVAMDMMPVLEVDSAVEIVMVVNKMYPVIRVSFFRLYDKVIIKGNPILIQEAKPAEFSKNPASV